VPENLLDEGAYERHTRTHYRDPGVARRYARRQSLARSPAEWLVGAIEKLHVRRGLRRLGAVADWRLLDAPAGSGKLQRSLTKASAFYCAADISPAMLAFGGAPVAAVSDAAQLPFRSSAFDAVVCLRLLHRVPSAVIPTMIAETMRVARTGVVVSYAGASRAPWLHRLVQRMTRRTGQRIAPVTRSQLSGWVRANGGRVLADRSISAGLTAERVAVVAVGDAAV
jgi:ubiquinone/menaquinone biosynthesis C-methylase UbiE